MSCHIVSFRLVFHMSSMIRTVGKPIRHDLIDHALTDQQNRKHATSYEISALNIFKVRVWVLKVVNGHVVSLKSSLWNG